MRDWPVGPGDPGIGILVHEHLEARTASLSEADNVLAELLYIVKIDQATCNVLPRSRAGRIGDARTLGDHNRHTRL